MKKQKSGLYRASVTVGGKRIYVSGHSQREIEAQKHRVRQEYETGCTCQDITWHELVVKWYNDIAAGSKRSTGTKNNIRSAINKWIIGTTDSRILARAIRRANIQQIINNASAQSPSIVRTIMVCLKQICMYGMELGVMSADHTNNCEDPTGYTSPHRQSVTMDQVEHIMDAIQGERIETAIMLLYYTGMRTGQMLALLWSDIDFTNHTISVTKSMEQNGHIKQPKTPNSIRVISMHSQLQDYLRGIRQAGNASVSTYLTYSHFKEHWKRLLFDCGYATLRPGSTRFSVRDGSVICDFTPHQLRHTFATACYDAGIDPLITSRLMGHANITVTQSIYTDITQQRQQVAQSQINNALTLHKQKSKTKDIK